MPRETRPFLGLGDSEEYPFHPALRIPPLQHPIPLLPSRRPSPLEPNARIDNGAHHPSAKLNTRAKALADAKLIGDEDFLKSSLTPGQTITDGTLDFDPFSSGARKRQKLDFFQLPKPSARSEVTKPPSFSAVPVLLNELHEPPPSAALFPPITANLADEAPAYRGLSGPALPSIKQFSCEEIPPKPPKQSPKRSKEGKQKRVYLRGRRPWTAEETRDLLKGVGIYGVGKWKSILHHEGLRFHPDRTTVDLKDRYRTCRLNEERTLDRHASHKPEETQDVSRNDSTFSGTPAPRELSNGIQEAEPSAQNFQTQRAKFTLTQDQDFNISTPQDFEGKQADSSPRKSNSSYTLSEKKQHLPRWTPEEDVNLSKGYQKYGFQWTAITKDPEMNLGHRSGPQVRDRFRLKYPLHYQASVPLPLPDTTKRTRRRKPDQDAKPSRSKPKPQGSRRQELTWILRDSSEPPQQYRSQPQRAQGLNGKSHAEPSSRQDPFSAGNSQEDRNSQPPACVPKPLDIDNATTTLSTPASLTTSDQSRQTSVEVDETRNMNIDDLLNDEIEPHSRLPPFKFPFDNDWGNEDISDSVTLPPLLWEDMTSRPLFDLE